MNSVTGIAPLSVWDVHEEWFNDAWRERYAWAQEHFPHQANRTYRAEFFLIDTPFVVLYDWAENDQGRRYLDPATDEPAREKPYTLILSELPPKHLLGKACP